MEMEVAQDIAVSLSALVRVQQEWSEATEEQRHELLLLARSIDRTLRELVDRIEGPRNSQ